MVQLEITRPIKAWWFCRERQLPHRDGRKVRIGSTHVHKGDLVICQSGLHASKNILDALEYAQGNILYRVECSGDIIEQKDKLVCTRRKYLASFDVTDLLRHFSRLCALDIIHLWDAPKIVKEYLRTGDESIRKAARDATRSATRDATRSATRDATWDAARSAAWDAARSAAWDAAWSATRDAARDTARSAAWNVAKDTARDAARSAAWDTARAKQQKRLHRMAIAILKERRESNSTSIKVNS